jgi:serine/threonine-protein kinase
MESESAPEKPESPESPEFGEQTESTETVETVETIETAEPQPFRESALSKLSGIALMIMILVVAGILSALTAMRFAIRGREVVTPDLVGKTQEEARQILGREGLLLKITPTKRFSADIPEGHVMDQIPSRGTRVKTNRSVKVLLSNGDPKYEVPNLMGSSLRTAQLALLQRHLTLGSVSSAYMSETSAVADQWPKPGAIEGSEPTVNVLVSLGQPAQDFIMPDLIGRRADVVINAARKEGFRIAPPNLRKSPGIEPGIIVQQKPQAGYRIFQTETIALDVSQ